eukprot:5247140-Prymnesium_polylepis.1
MFLSLIAVAGVHLPSVPRASVHLPSVPRASPACGMSEYAAAPTASTATAFSAARWHGERRRKILEDHPEEMQKLLKQRDDSWVLSLGLLLLPAYGWALCHAPD